MAYDQYIVGVAGVMASLLGFVLLYPNFLARLRSPSKLKTTASMDYFPKENKAGNNNPVKTTDVIIVGAGVAGASLAYALAKDGRRVHVIERDLNPPERIAGEGLMPGGYLKLIELGLEDCVEDIDSVRMLGYTLYRDGKEAPISYPLDNS